MGVNDWCVIGVRDMSEGLIDGMLREEQTAGGNRETAEMLRVVCKLFF